MLYSCAQHSQRDLWPRAAPGSKGPPPLAGVRGGAPAERGTASRGLARSAQRRGRSTVQAQGTAHAALAVPAAQAVYSGLQLFAALLAAGAEQAKLGFLAADKPPGPDPQ